MLNCFIKLVAVLLVLMSSNVFAETLTGTTKTVTTVISNSPTGRSSGYGAPAVDYVFSGTTIYTDTRSCKSFCVNGFSVL